MVWGLGAYSGIEVVFSGSHVDLFGGEGSHCCCLEGSCAHALENHARSAGVQCGYIIAEDCFLFRLNTFNISNRDSFVLFRRPYDIPTQCSIECYTYRARIPSCACELVRNEGLQHRYELGEGWQCGGKLDV